jgi:site-specific DNA-methyltransferase (adenine-specific)
MAKMLELFPELSKAKSLHAAQSRADYLAKTILRQQAISDAPEDFSSIEERIVLGNSVEVIQGIPDETFHAIITDPPFGIKLEDRYSSLEGQQSLYEDSAQSYENLLSMAPDLYRTLKKDGWLVWFFGMSWYQRCLETFTDAGFIVDPIPVIWDRSQGFTYTMRPDRYFARAYDVALLCIKGNPQMVQRGKPNILSIPPVATNERELVAERPVDLYAELIRRLTVKGETVADFFVGSGSCPAAAASLGRQYFGCELDPGRRSKAIHKIRAYTPDTPRQHVVGGSGADSDGRAED